MITTHPFLSPRSRKGRALPLSTLWACNGTAFFLLQSGVFPRETRPRHETDLHMVPRLRNYGAIPPLPHTPSWRDSYLSTRDNFTFDFTNHNAVRPPFISWLENSEAQNEKVTFDRGNMKLVHLHNNLNYTLSWINKLKSNDTDERRLQSQSN
jgi:hypothetical protein